MGDWNTCWFFISKRRNCQPQIPYAEERKGFPQASQTIQTSEKSALLLAQQAAAHGLSLEAWIEELASEKARAGGTTRHRKTRAAVEGILELQKQVKPDPEGWAVRDYIDYDRR